MTPLRTPAVWILAATVASLLLAEPSATSIANVRVFAVYEPVFDRQDVEILSRVRPDFVCRGWFKWHNTPDWQSYAPLAQACRDKGILLQGGITLAALYPGENGMDDAAFRDFSCHGTVGEPFHCRTADGGGWYHLSLYNPKVIDYLKRDVRLQIDAGAIGIWYDEIEGYYDWNPTEGYDPYACAAFRDWLIRKYCGGQGWSENDPRWQSQFGIDLAKHGGSIRTFDYLRHLQTSPGMDGKPLADNPSQGHPRAWATSANPLFREWGFAWDRKAAGTFRFDTVTAIFADLLADADRYAREKYGRTLLSTYNHNGTARPGVAFLQPHNGAQPTLRNNRLDGRVSYLDYYENLIADAAEVCPGQPVVFFVDWPGETDRLTALPRSDQTHFFRIYIPEAYAAGGEFALPLRGYSYLSAHQGTLGTLARMADFYREHAPFLRGSQLSPHQPNAPDRLTLRSRTSASGTAVHIVNHAFSTRDVWPQPRTNLCVTLPWNAAAPASAFAVSPDFPEQRPVPVSLKDGQLTLDVGTVTCSALVLLPSVTALRPVAGSAADGTHVLSITSRALALARDGRFTLWLPPGAAEFECLETGERLPAREGARFAAPAAGAFASGLLLDRFGIPMRHAPLAASAFRTDAWGRYRIPATRWEGEHPDVFTAWQHRGTGTDLALGDFWANWPDKPKTTNVVALSCSGDALLCIFNLIPSVPWCNVNSPAFTLSDDDTLEIRYSGRAAFAMLHADRRFYRFPKPLDARDVETLRLKPSEFKDADGTPFDPAAHPRGATFQLAPAAFKGAPHTLLLRGVRIVPDAPVKRLWLSAAAFDDTDVDNLRAGHLSLPPPPDVAARLPLARFTDPSPRLLANWAGKTAADEAPMVVIERVAPAAQAPFLRVTFPAGECGWGNANIPLPVEKLRGTSGLLLRLRAKPSADTVAIALHAATKSGAQSFFRADAEAGEAWSEIALPWSSFTSDGGQRFDPAAAAWLNLQLCRPSGALTRGLDLDVEAVDVFTAAPQTNPR